MFFYLLYITNYIIHILKSVLFFTKHIFVVNTARNDFIKQLVQII